MPHPSPLRRVARARARRTPVLLRLVGAPALALAVAATPAQAQTDYYNTDTGRPLRIEDAYPVERRAIEIQAAPLRLERLGGGLYTWGTEPELAVGILPRTQLEVGFPIVYADVGVGRRTAGLAGIEASVLHNLNVETMIPALAVVGSVHLPAGGFGPDRAVPSLKGIATKTLSWIRVHANAEWTFGERPAAGAAAARADELSLWTAGIAVDRPFPLRSLLLAGEVYARRPFAPGEAVEWNATVGSRYQLSPRLAVDGGIGRTLTGDEQRWFLTLGGAVAVGLPWRAR